ncbi:MFS transporter [Streptomyces sp. 900105755]
MAAAFASLMAFGTVPTPLWPLYQQRDHFGATTVTIAYAVMVVGAAFSFRSLGHLSDRIGRRRVIVPALLVAIAAAAVLAAWPALPGLIVGRFLTGVAVGLMASTATAYLTDLHHAAYPDRPHSPVPALVSTAANLGGLAMGPLLVGAAAQWLPAPLVTSYVVSAAVMAAFLVLVLSSPETVDVTLFDGDRPVRFALRPGHGAAFGAASSIGFFAFAVMGLFSSLGAIIVRGQLGISSSFIAGLTTFIAFAASALAQLALGRLTQPLARPDRRRAGGRRRRSAVQGSRQPDGRHRRPPLPSRGSGRFLRHRLSRTGPALHRLQPRDPAHGAPAVHDRLRFGALTGSRRRRGSGARSCTDSALTEHLDVKPQVSGLGLPRCSPQDGVSALAGLTARHARRTVLVKPISYLANEGGSSESLIPCLRSWYRMGR